MRRGLYLPEGRQYLAENVSAGLNAARAGDWRCPNPACGEPIAHVTATPRHRAYFKHAPGVADLESCFYFSEETPTRRYHDCVDMLEAELLHRYGQEAVQPEAWVDGVRYPLDLLVVRPGAQPWGFWYVTPRRVAMTPHLLGQAKAAGLRVTVFTHVDARKPSEFFHAKGQQAFHLDPGTGNLVLLTGDQETKAPLELWLFDDAGTLNLPAEPPPPPPPVTIVTRPAEAGAPAQAMFWVDPGPPPPPRQAPGGATHSSIPAPPDPLPAQARGRQVWAEVNRANLPSDLAWLVVAPADEWASQVVHHFLGRKFPFRISQACEFVAQRWRLHSTVSNARELVFLRAMHGFWQALEEQGYVTLQYEPGPIEVRPVKGRF